MVITRRNMTSANTARNTKIIEAVGYILLGAIATWCYNNIFSSNTHTNNNNYIGNNNDKNDYQQKRVVTERKAEKAWTLSVKLTFLSESDLHTILNEWTTVAKYCAEHEQFLLHYEVGISDSDPLVVHILERYRSKDEYLNIHKNGSAFLKFRPVLKKMQDEAKVKIEGFSYQELGYGFTSTTN